VSRATLRMSCSSHTRRSPDDGLRALFRKHLRSGFIWTTVETGAVTQGVADSNYLSDTGLEGWIEYKATRAFAVKFRPLQIGWHLRRHRYGGTTWIAVRRRPGDNVTEQGHASLHGDRIDELYLFQGADIESVAEHGCRSNRVVLRCEGGPARWQWQAVQRLLSQRS